MKKILNTVKVAQNSYQDEGDGVVTFKNGLCISDSNVQRNGTRYDIDSLDISKYNRTLTADHEDKLKNIIGRVDGLEKKDGSLVINKITYAVKQNPYARLAYNLLVNGFSGSFSTETIGPPMGEDGVHFNHELVGLSQVVTPNNYSAQVNSLVKNSLEQSKADGLNVDELEKELKQNTTKEEKMDEEIKQTTEAEQVEVEKVETETPEQVEAVEATNETEEKVENALNPDQLSEMISKLDEVVSILKEDLKEEDETEDTVEEDKKEEVIEEVTEADLENEVKEKEENKEENTQMNEAQIAEITKNAVAEALKAVGYQNAAEPQFEKKEEVKNSFADMNWKERYGKQVNAAWEALRLNSISAHQQLAEINEVNFNALKDAGLVTNAMTIESMGNFVISPEMHKEIIGKRTDYSALINATEWRETNSREFAFLRRKGDIDMKNVAMCVPNPNTDNKNLKPVSEYSATPVTEKMEEMAAVTVVCNAANRFFAVDLLSDAAAGYRNDYDRKRAQLVIAKLEKAVIANTQSITYTKTEDIDAMTAWLKAIAAVSDAAVNGVLLFNAKTLAALKAHALKAGVNGPLGEIFVSGEVPTIFGTPYIVVPNDLMPTIESADSVSHQVNGEEVNITHSAFYADLSEFVGYTSGGLQYDISTEAAYEEGGKTLSAYQRNEMVLRGSFFRGGAIKDQSRVAGIKINN